jgi:hypothetical protein
VTLALLAASAYDPGPGLTVAETLGLFLGIPALVIALVFALVYALTGRRGPRYRPGMEWTGEPEWWNGPEGGEAAVAGAQPTAGAGGARARF